MEHQPLNMCQKTLLVAYCDGDHYVVEAKDAANCGDGLLTYLVSALSTDTGCNQFSEGVLRLEAAIRILLAVQDVVGTELADAVQMQKSTEVLAVAEGAEDTLQQLVRQAFSQVENTAECGNRELLLEFLTVELSAAEDCDSLECAHDRLATAIRQVADVLSAFDHASLRT